MLALGRRLKHPIELEGGDWRGEDRRPDQVAAAARVTGVPHRTLNERRWRDVGNGDGRKHEVITK